MHELPVGRRHVRLAADVVPRGAVGRNGAHRDDQVTELQVLLEAAAGADPQEALHPELDELLHHDRRRRTAHPGRLHGDGSALVRAGVPEHAPLAVLLDRVVEVRLRDVLRAQRVAGKQAGLGVVAGVGSDVDRHGGEPRVSGADGLVEGASPGRDPRLLRGGSGRARLPRGRRPPRSRPFHGARERWAAGGALPRRLERRPVRPGLCSLRRGRGGRPGADADRRAAGGDRSLGGGERATARSARGPSRPARLRDRAAAGPR